MLGWKRRQWAVLVHTLPDLANLAVAGLVFGQVLSDRPFSWWLVLVGAALWVTAVSITITIEGFDEP